ncbi:MAG TPA: porin [Longimicrobiales bacterium]|nr:porin [Longimicrobiales bacterium]
MRRRSLRRLGLLLALAAPARLAAQRPDSVRVRFSGFAAEQFNTSSVSGAVGSTFETRLVRLTAEATVNGWIVARLQPDFSMGRLALADAWVDFRVDPRLQLRIGQFKKPFTFVYTYSETMMPIIERTSRIRGLEEALGAVGGPDGGPLYPTVDGEAVVPEEMSLLAASFYAARDIGASVHGALGRRLGYEVGVFNGQGPSHLDEDGTKSVSARVTLTPLPGVPLGFGADAQHASTVYDGELSGLPAARRDRAGNAFSADAVWGGFRHPGPNAVVEVAGGDDLVNDRPFLAAQGWLSWFQPVAGTRLEGIEPVARVSWGNPDTRRPDDAGWLVTPGVTLHFAGRNHLQMDWELFVPEARGVETAKAFRAQAQVYF